MNIGYSTNSLDTVFEALASKHRREILHLLSLQPFAIHQLAAERKLSLPAIHKHIKLLEKAGMVVRRKIGQTNFLTLNRASLNSLQQWISEYQAYWGSDKETLENYSNQLQKNL